MWKWKSKYVVKSVTQGIYRFIENENIVVLAATNSISILNDAFMRSSRFNIKISINLPTLEDIKVVHHYAFKK